MVERSDSKRRLSNALGLGVIILLASCGAGQPESNETARPSITQKALEDLQEKYAELAGDRLDKPVQWASEDIENIGDWEYRIVEFAALGAGDWEAELNNYGNDRWEVAWVEASPTGRVVMFKRPAISLLSKIPLSQLGRMMIGDSSAEQ